MTEVDDLNAVLAPGLEIDACIGGGGQSRVYRATDQERGLVALKLVTEEGRVRAEREISAGFGLTHPNLVEIYDAEPREVTLPAGRHWFFIEELIEGEVVSSLPGPWEPCDVLAVMRGLVSAVKYLWEERRIVHRDIKPDNIVRGNDGIFVLLDVGIGRHQAEPTLTYQGGLGPGTWGYYAPEQLAAARGRELDHRSDLFLIGVVGFELLEGALPFDPNSVTYVTDLSRGERRQLEGQPIPLVRLIDRLLAPEPHQRFRSCDRASDEILAAQTEIGCF